MSILLMSRIFRMKMGNCNRKLVAVRLADFANDDGRGIYPTVDRLATETELSERTVQRIIADFEREGLLVCRRRATGRPGMANHYDFDLAVLRQIEDGIQTGDSLSPVERGDTGAETGDTDDRDGCHGDTRTVIEPPIEPSNERERVSERDDGEDRPGTAAFQKRVQRFVAGLGFSEGEWPKWTKSTLDYIVRQFAALAEPDRKAAEESRDAFLGKCRRENTSPMPVGNFLRDKAWTLLSDADRKWSRELVARKEGGKAAAKPEGWAPAYGPVHAAELFRILLAGPQSPKAAPGSGVWLASHIRAAWPRLFAFRQATAIHGGMVLSGIGADLMEFVPVESGLMAQWRSEFRRRGWAELTTLDGMRGLYMPKAQGDFDGAVAAAIEAFKRKVDGDVDAAQA